jgi:hypothetical protein
VIPTLGGELHWLISPFDPGCQLTFGPTSALLHFIPDPGPQRFQVAVISTDARTLPGEVQVTVHATRGNRPLRRAQVTFAGAAGRTNRQGIATVSTFLELPGRFRALARRGQSYGVSELVPIGIGLSTLSAAAPRSGAG